MVVAKAAEALKACPPHSNVVENCPPSPEGGEKRRLPLPTQNQHLTISAPAFIEILEHAFKTGVKAPGPTFQNMTHPLQRTAFICLVFILGLFMANPAVALPPAAPLDYVALTAWMDLTDGNASDVIVEVNVNGVKDWGRPDEDGRVELMLPADAVALIHFRKPGHLTKTVSVDTHNMQKSSFNGKKAGLTFGVKLEADTHKEGLAYAGPVGTIAFDAATGTLMIDQDHHLVPGRPQKVVF